MKVIRNPDIYHGTNKKPIFFEGWYFKIVQADTGLTYCFIPGVFFSKAKDNSHSFIQILNGNKNNLKYLRFRKDEFQASSSKFHLKVDKSTFSLNRMHLNINQPNVKIFGTLSFENITKWPDSIFNPGSMGFYNYLSFMQCYSQVCVVDGSINGKLNIDGEIVDFSGGKLYIEKNWGKAFPYSYIWIQGNSFRNGDGSVTCSIGHIPFPFRSFTGFLIGLYVKGKFYKFTSINRSTLSVNHENEIIVIETYNKDYYLKIEASYNQKTFVKLFAPRKLKMIPIASETLHGNLIVSLFDLKRKRIIYHDNCSSAGIELSENYLNLINNIKNIN